MKLFRFERWNFRAFWMRTPDGKYFMPLFLGIWIRIPVPDDERIRIARGEYDDINP